MLLLSLEPARAQSPALDDFSPGVSDLVNSIVVQADGRILVGGNFFVSSDSKLSQLVRFLPNGEVDRSFRAKGGDAVTAMLVQADGGILLGCRTEAGALSRLLPDGVLDSSYNPQVSGRAVFSSSTFGAPGVLALAAQANGQVLLAGNFASVGGQPRPILARINPDGSLDAAFAPTLDRPVSSVGIQADGRILIGGEFTSVGGQARQSIARLNADGTLDPDFNPGANYPVFALVVEPTGTILVGGAFSTLGGGPCERMGRLDASGRLIASFNPGVNSQVETVALQTDGRILIGGLFSAVAGQSRPRIARLLGDGSLDGSFNPNPNETFGGTETVTALGIQADGRILIGGTFTHFAGRSQLRLARLNNTGIAASSLSYDASSITWSRSGTCPEIDRAVFRISTNRTDWSAPIQGDRIAGGWRVTSQGVPAQATLLVQGAAGSGRQHGSRSIIEVVVGPPAILRQPSSLTVNAGSPAVLSARAVGESALTYQWKRGAVALADDGHISGSRTPTLSLENVTVADRGEYLLEVTASNGTVTSTPATLRVLDPYFLTQPASLEVYQGQPAGFSVSANGTSPLSYQWRKNGVPLPGQTNATLNIAAAVSGDAGSYDVVASDNAGSNASNPAELVVRKVVGDFDPHADGVVRTLAVQPDGMILLGGEFNHVQGQARPHVVRVSPSGEVDAGFNAAWNLLASGSPGSVGALAVLPDGKILVGLQYERDHSLARLLNDGTLDAGFSAHIAGGTDIGGTAVPGVHALLVERTGMMVVAGNFTQANGQARRNLARFAADGTLDTTFNPDADAPVTTIAQQPDGKILIGGTFAMVGGRSRQCIARLEADGTVDATFNPGANLPVYALCPQPDGKILVGGSFTLIAGQTRQRLARLGSGGAVDPSFPANLALDAEVESMVLQADGKVLVGGRFRTVGGQPRKQLARLNPDGTLDARFDPRRYDSDSGGVHALAIDPAGGVLAAGSFTYFAKQPLRYLAHAMDEVAASEVLTLGGTTANWRRDGSAPEIQRAVLDFSTNLGATWSTPTEGNRVAGGWSFDGVQLPGLAIVRARGVVTGGSRNGSTWITETRVGPPDVIREPQSRIAALGGTATFDVTAGGTPPLTYQWRHGTAVLADSGTITGATSPRLTLSQLTEADAGVYTVVITSPDGTATSSQAVLDVRDPCIVSGPASQEVYMGQPATMSVVAGGSPTLRYEWLKNGVLIPGESGPTLTIASAQPGDAGTYTVRASNSSGSQQGTAVLKVRRIVDDLSAVFSGPVSTVLPQPDGMILAGGEFSSVSGVPVARIARLRPDGLPDPGFQQGLATLSQGWPAVVGSLALLPDMKIMAGIVAENPQRTLLRLNPDGTLDTSFSTEVSGGVAQWSYRPGTYSIHRQPDGKLIIAGIFSSVAGQPRANLARLNADGTLDASFRADVDGPVLSLALQPDGKILVGGQFGTVGGKSHWRLARLAPDGTPDASFDPAPNYPIFAIAVQLDGRIVVGGSFDRIAGAARARLARLESNGTLDASFTASVDAEVQSILMQTDGKLLVGGRFNTLNNTDSRKWIMRLNSNGTLDPRFEPTRMDDPGGYLSRLLYSVALEPDGSILSGGVLSSMGGVPRINMARLMPDRYDVPASNTLAVVGSTGTWMRSGPGPEIEHATLEYAINGGAWSPPVAGTRIDGGWQFQGITPPAGATFRARGFLSGAGRNSSTWFIQITLGPPWLEQQPVSQIHASGESAVFFSSAVGSGQLSYQWLKDGNPVADDDRVSGSRTPVLRINNLNATDRGLYSVIVTNAMGQATSTVANLLVGDPTIVTQPVGQQAYEGQSASFNVSAWGSPPLQYQWRKNGAALPGALASTLELPYLKPDDAGSYDVVVNSAFGSVTSSVAPLKIFTRVLPDDFDPSADDYVASIVEQPDGRILVGGGFTRCGGAVRRSLARLEADGSLDTSFDPGADDAVLAMGVQADGRIVAGGQFTSLAGRPCAFLGRLNRDGTLDATFGAQADWIVSAVALQPDGKILVGGGFTGISGKRRNYLARLNPDGTLDQGFNPVPDGPVYAIALQPDGGIVVGGEFTSLGGIERRFLGRLKPDGTGDPAWTGPGASWPVTALVVQPDGRVLSGGELRRFSADGTWSFPHLALPDGLISAIALQSDGGILVAGEFHSVGGVPRQGLARLNADGSLDGGFNPGVRGSIYAMALQADGRVLAAGDFNVLAGQTRHNLGRLSNSEPAAQQLSHTPTAITWTRSGTGPQVWRVTFESSSDGIQWGALGEASAIPGGWQLHGLNLSNAGIYRARGYVANGVSTWPLEAFMADTQITIPLRLDPASPAWMSDGRFRLRLTSTPGAVLRLEARSGFGDGAWHNLGTITNQSGSAVVVDPETGQAQRYFRLQQVR